MRLLIEPPGAYTVSPIICGVCKQPPKYFALRPKGMGLWQLILCLKGEGRLVHPGGEIQLLPGHVILFRPEARQHYGNPTSRRWHHLAFAFHAPPHWERWLEWPDTVPGIGLLRTPRDASAIRDELLAANQAAHELHPFNKELAMDHLHAALVRCQAEFLRRETPGRDARVTKLIEEMGRDLSKTHRGIPALARDAGMSTWQLFRVFRRQVGLSPSAYLEKLRLERAAELLRTTPMRIREVSFRVGYEDPLYFSKRFRAATGLSPRQYREHSGTEPA